ncbi:hypothetical protein DYB30_002775 [Aphanomyces astaci]|uniref:Uncharacterized protein n=1 Tax=Aphanomyces astaci TaxID=112090 RepID=A0A397CFB6_APHAT|nr:hypothetical protein DYB30_002775 [Aphanomyces astaci]
MHSVVTAMGSVAPESMVTMTETDSYINRFTSAMLQPKRPKKKCVNLELPSITLYEPVLSVKPTRHHVPLDEVQAPTEGLQSPSKPKSPLRPVDKVATALGSKASHLAHRVIIRPIFEDRKELQAELARQILEQRMLDEDELDDTLPISDHVLHQSHDIFHARVLLPLDDIEPPTPRPNLVAPAVTSVPDTHRNPSRLHSPTVDHIVLSSPSSLQFSSSLSSFGGSSAPPSSLKMQTSISSFPESDDRTSNRRRSVRPRSRDKSNDQSHAIFMVPEKLLCATKRASLPSSPSVASLRHPFQKLLLVASRLFKDDSGVDVDCTVSIHMLSTGDVTVAVSEMQVSVVLMAHATGTLPFEAKGLTLSAHDASTFFLDEDLEVYSPPWAATLASHVSVEHSQVVLLPPTSRHVVLSMQQDVPSDLSPHPLLVQAVAVHNGLCLRVSPDHDLKAKSPPLHLHVSNTELARIILRMDNMHVSADHVAQLTQQKAWCAMFLRDMHALVELALRQRQLSPLPVVSTSATTADVTVLKASIAEEPAPHPPSTASTRDPGFASEDLNDVCRVAQSLAEIVLSNTVLWLQKQEAALLYSRAYVKSFSRRPGAADMVLASYQAKEHEVSHAKLIQTLQRGISARKRYIERKLERERYLYFGFRSTLVAQSKWDNPSTRLAQRCANIEARRVTFLMGVLTGAFLFHKPMTTAMTMLPVSDVVSLLNRHGLVVGCPSNLGSTVAAAFQRAYGCHHSSTEVVSVAAVQTALISVLRGLQDDTFGRPLHHASLPPSSLEQVGEAVVPRWLLKATPSLHAANLAKVLALREATVESGRQSAHLIAYHFRVAVLRPMSFEQCRDEWHKAMTARYDELCRLAQSSVDELVLWGVEKLQEAVKGVETHCLK